jgi:branched-chain amino acid transport system substrate-binding protein
MSVKKLVLTLTGAATIAGLSWSAQAADPVRLGFIEPLSGPVAAVGRDQLEQFEFIVNRINDRGGVLGGRKLEIVQLDNAMNAEKSIQQLKKAIDQGIKFVTQGVGSNHALNIIKFLEKHNKRNPDNRVLYLNSAAVTTAFTNELCSFWHFRFDANVDMKVAALTTQMGRDSKVKNVYLLNQNYAYGKSFQAAARKLLKERAPNASLVGDELIVPFGKVQDFTPYIAKIQSAGADTILTGNWGPDLARFVKAAGAAGLDTQFYTIYAGIPSSISAIGADTFGQMSVKQVGEYHDNDSNISPEAREAAAAFESTAGKSWYADRFRWLLNMFAAALDKAGKEDPQAVALALEGMSFKGPNGDVVMRAKDHQIQLPMVVSTGVLDAPKKFVYNGETLGMGWKTDSWVTRADLELPTTCSMERPK